MMRGLFAGEPADVALALLRAAAALEHIERHPALAGAAAEFRDDGIGRQALVAIKAVLAPTPPSSTPPRFEVWPGYCQPVTSSDQRSPTGYSTDVHWQPRHTERDADGWIVVSDADGATVIHLSSPDDAFDTPDAALRHAKALATLHGGSAHAWGTFSTTDDEKDDARATGEGDDPLPAAPVQVRPIASTRAGAARCDESHPAIALLRASDEAGWRPVTQVAVLLDFLSGDEDTARRFVTYIADQLAAEQAAATTGDLFAPDAR